MSQKDYEAALNRVKHAVEDIQWALSVLDDPSSQLKEYHLTTRERKKLLQEYHALLADIHVLQAQTLLKKVRVRVKNKEMQVVGPIPSWIEESEAEFTTEAVPPIPPYETPSLEEPHQKPGQHQASSRSMAVPPIPPYETSDGSATDTEQ